MTGDGFPRATRRELCAASAVALAGCTGLGGSADEPLYPEPEQPAALTAETVAEHVRAFERNQRARAARSDGRVDDSQQVEVNCRVPVVDARGDVYYAVAPCDVVVRDEQGIGETWGSLPVAPVYRVTPDATERVQVQQPDVVPRTDLDEDGPAVFAVGANFGSSDRSVEVRITPGERDEERLELRLGESHAVRSHRFAPVRNPIDVSVTAGGARARLLERVEVDGGRLGVYVFLEPDGLPTVALLPGQHAEPVAAVGTGG